MIDLLESKLRTVVQDPKHAAQWLMNCVYTEPYLAARSVNQWYHSRFGSAGDLDVVAEDWDVLVLIDACRYDDFADVNHINGRLEKRRSPGSMSKEFIHESFVGRTLHDSVYVTGNPFVADLNGEEFHDVISLVEDSWEAGDETVPPERLASATREALAEYPQKRIIAHFMQPHAPFLTDFGREVMENLVWRGNQYFPVGVSDESVRRAYRENIEYVLDVVADLVDDIENRVVISSDHGELMGERCLPIPIKGWEHPISLYEDGLLEVPWMVIDGEQRDIVAEAPSGTVAVESETIEKRLKALGYR